MASHGGASNQVRDRVIGDVNGVLNEDQYNSQWGFRPHREDARQDLTRDLIETVRSPETVRQILDSGDADARLLEQLLCERRGIRGVGRRISQSFLGRMLGMGAVGYAAHGASEAGLQAVGQAVVENSGKESAKAVMDVLAPAFSATVGATMGGLWGWLRGKDQEYSAATWMQNLSILRASKNEIDALPDEQLYASLGILKNAIDSGAIRGRSIHKLEMVAKYNQIKNLLRTRVIEARAGGAELNPVLARLDAAIDGSTQEMRRISEAAGAEFKDIYGRLSKMKKKKVTATVVKGAIVGGLVGGVARCAWILADKIPALAGLKDAIVNSPVVQNVSDWAREHLPHFSVNASGVDIDGGQDLLHQRMEELRNGVLQPDIASHDANLGAFNQEQAMLAGDMSGGGDTLYSPDMNTYDPQHLENLQAMGGRLDGFGDGGLDQFNQHLANGDMSGITEQASIHNIDIYSEVANGQKFSEFLINNKEAYLSLPPEVQNFVVSHPSIAEEFVQVVSQNNPESYVTWLNNLIDSSGLTTDQLTTSAALAGIGVGALGYAGADAIKRRLNAQEQTTADSATDKYREPMNEWRRTNEAAQRERQQEAMQAVNNELVGSNVIINPALFGRIGYVLPRGRRNDFVVDRVDPDGRIVFRNTEEDLDRRRRGVEPHPQITVADITNNNRINRDLITVVGAAAAAGGGEGGEPVDLERYERLLGGTHEGQIQSRRGRLFFRPNSARALPVREVQINAANADRFIGLPVTVRLNDVSESGGNPEFSVDVMFMVNNGGPIFYGFESSLRSGGGKPKNDFMGQLRTLERMGNQQNYLIEMHGNYYQYESNTPGAPAVPPPAGSPAGTPGTPATPEIFTFVPVTLGGGATGPGVDLEPTDINSNQITLFTRRA